MNGSNDADVVVVGSGNAALSAALSAAEAGASVVVLEKASAGEAGGNSWYTAGAFRVAHGGMEDVRALLARPDDPRLDATELEPYPPERYLDDLQRLTDGRCDHELAAVLAHESLEGLRWLRGHGIAFELMYHRQAYRLDDGRERFWGGLAIGVVGGGKELVRGELRAVEELGIPVVYDAPVRELWRDDAGRIVGVKLDGGTRWRAGSVVLACGGFQADPAMRSAHLGARWRDARLRGTPHNTGDGLRMALEVGAARAGDWGTCHAVAWDVDSPESGDRELTNRFTKQSYPLGITVNARGERFFDEGADFRNYTYAALGAAIIEQPGGVAWQLFDAKTRPLLRPEEYEVPGTRRHEAADPRELARLTGIEPDGLERTLREFNAAVRPGPFDPTTKDGKRTHGIDPPKSNWALPLDEPPFVAVEVTGAITFTFGGLRIDTAGRVLTDAGHELPGLYAAGEIAGGLFAGNYPGGSGLSAGTVFGRRAGAAAARHAIDANQGVTA